MKHFSLQKIFTMGTMAALAVMPIIDVSAAMDETVTNDAEPAVIVPQDAVATAGARAVDVSERMLDFLIRVQPDGDDANSGKHNAPLRTFERARDEIRRLRREHPEARLAVAIGPGTFVIPADTPWRFTAEDSGTLENPIVWYSPENSTTLSGGVRVTGWKSVTDAAVLDRLPESSRKTVVMADLAALGVTDSGDATQFGKSPELFCDGIPQTLSRYPNDDFLKIGKTLGATEVDGYLGKGVKEGIFEYSAADASHIDCWAAEPDARLFGYFFWDWSDSYGRVEKIDPATKTITMRTPYHGYGYREGQRFRGVNLLCELDATGEWYLDRSDGHIYWIPPTGVDLTKAEVTLSVCAADAMIDFDGATDIQLHGVRLIEGRGDAIHVHDGKRVLISGCTIERFGGTGIRMERGVECGITDSTLRTLGQGGTTLSGGDRRTLTPGRNFILRTTVENFSRLQRTYAPAVLLEGCGNRIAENLFRGSSSSAIRIEGNDHLIERNRFVELVNESDDQGGIDIFYDPGYRGIVIRDNYFVDIVGGTHCGAAAIRLDDMISGVTITGNVIERCGSVQFGGVQIHGGKDNLVAENLFIDCFAVVSFSCWGEARWLKILDETEMRRKLYEVIDINSPVWRARYPELARLRENADVNTLRNNRIAGGCSDGLWLRDGGIQRIAENVVLFGEPVSGATATAVPGLPGIESKLNSLTERVPELKIFTRHNRRPQ